MNKPNAKHILKACWNELLWHQKNLLFPERFEIFIIPEERTLSIADGQSIKPLMALATLDSWIRKSLKTYGAVYLYTCKDNALISVEFPQPDWDLTPDEFGNRGPYEIQPDTPGLFIGFD